MIGLFSNDRSTDRTNNESPFVQGSTHKVGTNISRESRFVVPTGRRIEE